MKLQQILIRYLLSPLYQRVSMLSLKTREYLFIAAGLAIVLQYFLRSMNVADYRYLLFYAVDCVFFAVMILCGMEQEPKPLRFRLSLFLSMLVMGALLLISGLVNSVDYLPEAMLLLVAYPIAYLCWWNGDHDRIFGWLIRICRISFYVFFVGSFLFAEISASAYPGLFVNVNGTAGYLAVVAVGLFADILRSERSKGKTFWDILLLGAVLAMLYYTNSRTGQLAVIAAFLFALVIRFARQGKDLNLRLLKKLAILCLVTVLCTLTLVYAFSLRSEMRIPYYDSENGVFYRTYVTDSVDDSGSQEDNISDNTGVKGFKEQNELKTDMEGKSLDRYSTGRISIWKAYLEELNWTGHPASIVVHIDLLDRDIHTAHMVVLEYAYESGILAGIVYLIFNILSGIAVLIYAWKKTDARYGLYPLMIVLVFAVHSVLSSCNISFWYLGTFYYYLVLFPVMVNAKRDAEEA
ncbi:MAG: O-antigen ligase family protein [Firmicutes bacterium]|nr:O-antigen ligase family protein [Bacillota bacterium]